MKKETHAKINLMSSWYLTKFSRDIYLPSLPAIAVALSTNSTHVQYSVTLYFLGLAISRFLWTPLSDMYGRRPIILLCLPLFLVGTIIDWIAPGIWTFLLGRFFQALGIGCLASLGRAMINDIYVEQKKMTKALTYLSFIGVWAPAFATAIGGHLQQLYGWRADSVFLTICGVLLLLQSIFILKETNLKLLPKEQVVKQIATNYKILLKSAVYMRYVICFSLIFAGTVVYYTASPFLFVHEMKIPAHIYGYFAFITVSGILIGKVISARLVDIYDVEDVIQKGILASLVGATLMLICGVLFKPGIVIIMLPTFIYFLGMGIMSTTSRAASITAIEKMAGAGAALFGVGQGLAASFFSLITAHFHEKTVLPMALILVLLSCLALITFQNLGERIEREGKNL
jgi:Bcr/CflA subfamily drug resistance transporter